MTTDDRPLYTADHLRRAVWSKGAVASAQTKRGASTVRLSECKIDGVTVRGSVQTWADGSREVVYGVHGQTVHSLEEVAALLSGRWSVGSDVAERDD